MESWNRNLELLIKSRASIIWIKTKEEERLKKILDFSCERLKVKRFVCWDCVNGITGVINEKGNFTNNPLGVISDAFSNCGYSQLLSSILANSL